MIQNMQSKPRILLLSILASACLATLITGCAPVTQRAEVEDRVQQDPQAAYERGAYRAAARAWEQQAMEATDAEATKLRLRAMDAWVQAGEAETARNISTWIDPTTLSEADEALFSLLIAELDIEEQNPVGARRSLARVGTALPTQYADRYQGAMSRVQAMLGNLGTQNVQQAGELAQEIQSYDAESALALLRTLESVSSGQLARLAGLGGDMQRAAWFDLALVIRENLVEARGLETDIVSWKARHPDFGITTADALDLWLRYRQTFQRPERIAILLPESGGLKRAGAAIRDGLMHAYLAMPGDSEIRFYDTGGGAPSVPAAYFEAADYGADWIIGPLDRPSIEALFGLAGLVTPVLALNELPEDEHVPAGLEQQVFGISLSQEKEAAAVARRMVNLGLKKTLVLAPANEWGDRISNAFEESFLQAQGETLIATRYMADENDHSQVLEEILQIAQSKERKTRLENRLSLELEFEPVRRSDIDSIFLAADPDQGRQLTPQLRFFDVGSIPTFSTSRVFTGQPDPSRNRDLNGLNLPITAWQLEHATPGSVPRIQSLLEGRFAPLYAIGIDAWDILPWLRLMRSDPDFSYPGQSGTWSINDNGKLVREPYWGQFQGGRPQASGAQAR